MLANPDRWEALSSPPSNGLPPTRAHAVGRKRLLVRCAPPSRRCPMSASNSASPVPLLRPLASRLPGRDGGGARARWLTASREEEERAAAREAAAPLSRQGRRQRCWAGPGSGLAARLQGLCEALWGCEARGEAVRAEPTSAATALLALGDVVPGSPA